MTIISVQNKISYDLSEISLVLDKDGVLALLSTSNITLIYERKVCRQNWVVV